MQKISVFVTSVTGIILISIIAENVCSDKYKKYVKFAVGLIILYVVSTSFLDFLQPSYEMNLHNFYIEDQSEYTIKNEYNEQIKKLFTEKLKNELESNIYKKMHLKCAIAPEINDEFSEISLEISCNNGDFRKVKEFINENYEIYDITFVKEVKKYEK